jgi:hypothetical protein
MLPPAALPFAAWLLAAAPAAADGPVWDRVALGGLDWGIICVDSSGRRAEAPGTIAGFIDIYAGEAVIGQRTLQVPALPETAFGFLLTGDADGAAEVLITVFHPPMQPGGRTVQSWVTAIAPGETTASFFRFDLAEERVPGAWRFVATEAGRVLLDATFEVADPAAMPGFADPCPGPLPVS